MLYACLGIVLLTLGTFLQMLLPRQAWWALIALCGGGAGIYFGFEASLWTGLTTVLAALVVVPLAVYLSLRVMAPYEPQLAAEPAAPVDPAELSGLQGLSGVALTPIAPAGIALIAAKRVNVIAQTAPIAEHTAVVVAAVEGTRVTVRSA